MSANFYFHAARTPFNANLNVLIQFSPLEKQYRDTMVPKDLNLEAFDGRVTARSEWKAPEDRSPDAGVISS